MSHAHSHHQVSSYNRAFAAGVALNVAFVLVEVLSGLAADSLALLADAGHNLSDVVSLLLAWGASLLAGKSATENRTYGFRKATVMASLMSAVLLLAALGIIVWEAVGRLMHPAPVQGLVMLAVAAAGVFVNGATALLFVKGQRQDLNIRGVFLHMAADAGVSLGVVIAGGLILWKGWLWVDPVVTFLVVAVVFAGTWNLLKDSMNYALDAVPANVDMPALKRYLAGCERIETFHDLHVWPMSTSEVALTVHIVVRDAIVDNDFLCGLQQQLHDHFGICHSTIQVESSLQRNSCMLDQHPE